MLPPLALAAALILGAGTGSGAKKPAKVIALNESVLFAEPKFWASKVGSVGRADSLTVLKETGGWLQVKTARGLTGFVPRSVLESGAAEVPTFQGDAPTQTASAAQAANASRGFSSEAHAADVSNAQLKAADERIAGYEGYAGHDDLQRALAQRMPRFVKDGKLKGGAP